MAEVSKWCAPNTMLQIVAALMHYTAAEREREREFRRICIPASAAAFATGKQFALDALHQAHHHRSARRVCVCDLLVI